MPIYVAKTLHGLETVLAGELTALGATDVSPLKRAVSFEGDRAMLYRANYLLRTALRILQSVHEFSAYDERNLYTGIRSVDWSRFLSVRDTLAVDAVTQGEVFRHSHYAALTVKDAIVDQFRDRYGRRPDVNTASPSVRINVHIHGTRCEVSLDSSGESLHKRGYRRDTVEAPLSEVLAAGMVLLSGWGGRGSFVDPMCGSGTLAIEAAMLAAQIPPQFKRPAFGFFKWPDFDRKLWEQVKREADARIQAPDSAIIAADKDTRARNATAVNVLSAGLENAIRIEKIPFEKLTPPDIPGTLMTNPPYDERLSLDSAGLFYKSMGDRLKQAWTGWDAWVISSNRDALKHFGLRPSRRITLFNGALECSFQKFELYEGSKRKPEPAR